MSKVNPDLFHNDFEDFDNEPEILTEYYEDQYDQPHAGVIPFRF